jgi:hypothetical protein
MDNEPGLPRTPMRRMNTRRRLAGLVFAMPAAIVLVVAAGGPGLAGTKPPNCGTPNTPPCSLPMRVSLHFVEAPDAASGLRSACCDVSKAPGGPNCGQEAGHRPVDRAPCPPPRRQVGPLATATG